MSFSDSSFRRRDLAGLAAAVAAVPVVALASGAAPAGAAPAPATTGPRVRLRAEGTDSPVSAVDVPLAIGAGGLARAGGPARTAALDTDRFALLGVTWRDGRGAVRVRARVRAAGGAWSAWRRLPVLHDRPDPATAEGRATPSATEPVWVGPSDGVQVEVDGAIVQPVLTLIDPGVRSADSTVTPTRAPAASDAAVTARTGAKPKKKAPNRQPAFYSRAQWGADPTWASGRPVQVRTVKQVHVHHTATGNDYAAADVPGILRGIYRYHTKSLGWSDVGYNFFVDRFGRIWAGRRRPKHETQGAHTLGFNHVSVGIAVLGNHEVVAPSDAVIAGVTRVAAWKLAKYHRNAAGTIKVTSRGSDKYRKGRAVVLPVIDGHRDTNDTDCPGRYLYAELPRIRARTARRIRRFNA
ncbi:MULTISPECIES: N-acetylmuramoyl-L-alanine amidase [Pimelobacter]|uniref:N-acetylmuramoyl-L-alanine amidase n=1 Tax=Pimelobacter TaxID=2044 RepID=UPI001C0547CA|nr:MULTISPECIES: N-acetylmuramoyl-L-alanine amidase [Pimelobacter]UUW87042.1 N-acetylmuramoyl-L-alanine amidase [Pimelobacter simplex]